VPYAVIGDEEHPATPIACQAESAARGPECNRAYLGNPWIHNGEPGLICWLNQAGVGCDGRRPPIIAILQAVLTLTVAKVYPW